MSNLRELANTDLESIMTDKTNGFGWDIELIDTAGVSYAVVGRSDDIGQVIDPDTGMPVSGRLASVSVTIASLDAVGAGLPQGIADTGGKPWVVKFDDINGRSYSFKVIQSNPDRALGIVICLLEAYIVS